MGESVVLRVQEVNTTKNLLVVYDGGDSVVVKNNVQDDVSPGDLVEVERKSIGKDEAISLVKEGNLEYRLAVVKRVSDSGIIVETEDGIRSIPEPNFDLEEGQVIELSYSSTVNRIIDDEPINLDSPTTLSIEGLSDQEDQEDSPDDYKSAPKDVPDVTYKDIGGLDEEKREVQNKVELPLKHPERFDEVGTEPPLGVLFYGPPGTGKTMLARAVANTTNANFFSIRGPELSHKLVGETERKLRELFEEARNDAPSIIFFDEIDSIAPRRDESRDVGRRTVGQLLSLMDGLESRGQVIVIGTTNYLEAIDPALRRPGRFDREIEFTPPSREGRYRILEIHSRNMSLDSSVDLNEIVDKTSGWTGSHLKSLLDEAGEILIEEGRSVIYPEDLTIAYQRVQSQINNQRKESRRKDNDSNDA